MGAMFRACDLRLGLNFEVRPAADKNFCWRLILETMCACAVFTIKNIYGHSSLVAPILHYYYLFTLCLMLAKYKVDTKLIIPAT